LINPLDIIDLPTLEVNESELKKLENGNKFNNRTKLQGEILLVNGGRILALALADEDFIQPRKLL
jgi:hypothetical protein